MFRNTCTALLGLSDIATSAATFPIRWCVGRQCWSSTSAIISTVTPVKSFHDAHLALTQRLNITTGGCSLQNHLPPARAISSHLSNNSAAVSTRHAIHIARRAPSSSRTSHAWYTLQLHNNLSFKFPHDRFLGVSKSRKARPNSLATTS